MKTSIAAISIGLIATLIACTPAPRPIASPSPVQATVATANPVVTPTPEDDESPLTWRIYLSRPGMIISGPIVKSGGAPHGLTGSVFPELGPPVERIGVSSGRISFDEEIKGSQFRFLAVPSSKLLLATESDEGTLFTIPLESGLPANLKPSELKLAVTESVLVGQSLYAAEGQSNSIVRLQVEDSGQVKSASTYPTKASLPGIAYDSNRRTLWVAEGNLTSFDLSQDPDMKKPETLLKGGYRDVTFLPVPKLLILETKVLPGKAFEVFAMGPKGLTKQGGFKLEAEASAYGFSEDGRWMIVGGSQADMEVRSYRLEGAAITKVDTLDIGSGSDRLDVYDRLVVIDRGEDTVVLSLAEDGKLSLKETLSGTGALMVPFDAVEMDTEPSG